ncbi:MAG: hypothetical protein JXM73_07815 [Anaerolineae bacterium]|nr:hypothetical protein [Anaerolineae bacterium]
MFEMATVLRELARKRPVFHSEADFQHALAWEIHHQWPECAMRLEFKPPHVDARMYLDIWATDKTTTLAIELKYKTRRLSIKVKGEDYELLNQSAQDIGRYDFWRDVQRVEQVVAGRPSTIGYVIFLTNDSAYWTPRTSGRTIDAAFRMHPGRKVTGELRWGTGASKGTMRGREKSIQIKGTYSLTWEDYSVLGRGNYNRFRYLSWRIPGGIL